MFNPKSLCFVTCQGPSSPVNLLQASLTLPPFLPAFDNCLSLCLLKSNLQESIQTEPAPTKFTCTKSLNWLPLYQVAKYNSIFCDVRCPWGSKHSHSPSAGMEEGYRECISCLEDKPPQASLTSFQTLFSHKHCSWKLTPRKAHIFKVHRWV